MDLLEFQARDLFVKQGVAVLDADVADTPEAAVEIARRLGGRRVVIKAQVKIGRRGKAAGVKLANNPDDARDKAAEILGLDIKGHTVRHVMVTQAASIVDGYYFSVPLDRANGATLAMASTQGGMDIEQIAATTPETLAKIPVSSPPPPPPARSPLRRNRYRYRAADAPFLRADASSCPHADRLPFAVAPRHSVFRDEHLAAPAADTNGS